MCNKQKNTDAIGMQKMIKKVSGQKICSSPGCLKSKERTIMMGIEKILQVEVMYRDLPWQQETIHKSLEEHDILKFEKEQNFQDEEEQRNKSRLNYYRDADNLNWHREW